MGSSETSDKGFVPALPGFIPSSCKTGKVILSFILENIVLYILDVYPVPDIEVMNHTEVLVHLTTYIQVFHPTE